MLSRRAYSFRRQARLAFSLAWVAGFVNAIVFLESAHLFVSHLTGAFALGGLHAVHGEWASALLLLEICVAFFLGAAASAVLTEVARKCAWRSRFAAAILLEAILLGLLCLLLARDLGGPRAVLGVAAFAMGLQNATITQISGAVVRTTHLTGVVTDLGIESVQAWGWWRDPTRRVRPAPAGARLASPSTWHPRIARLAMLVSLVLSFLAGVAAGGLGHAWLPHFALLLPIAFLLGVVLFSWCSSVSEIRELDPVAEADLRGEGQGSGALPPGVGVYWLGRSQPLGAHPDYAGRSQAHLGAPDFEAWAQRLPPSTRDAVLVLSPNIELDRDASLDLGNVVRRLHEAGRRLWLAGPSEAQRRALEETGALAALGPERAVADVRAALAGIAATAR
jgi:uncharacterized membrane protein YoaK (UPF0700 family)